MKNIFKDDLKRFQSEAANEITGMLTAYPGPVFKPWFNPETGNPYPFLCRLRAITGSGKTPILAASASNLGDAIVLWTTNRGAVISQTATNLTAGGRYSGLLPLDTQVVELSDLTATDWSDVITAKSGLTIILSTVALFNREDDILNVHKERNGASFWEMLAGQTLDGRSRPLYIIYDEAHGGTTAQFSRLTELSPRAFILASATDLPEDVINLLPGKNSVEKSEALKCQTVSVKTSDVVDAGLLKTRLYFVDCNTTRRDALKEANDKWFEITKKLRTIKEWPVMCCIVNSSLAGLEVWETLTQDLGVDPRRVAVHLANIDKSLADANPNAPWQHLIDTYKGKKTPEALRDEGYTHLVWNLSLREGWDEPWAYIAYLDRGGKSALDISQKIGRFLRQPNATPFDDGDLNSAYFYFNVPDEEFIKILNATQAELENDGHEIIAISSTSIRPSASRESPVKNPTSIAQVSGTFGEDLNLLDKILLDNVPLFEASQLKAPGRITTRVLDLRFNAEDMTLKKEEARTDNTEIQVWNYLINRLASIDSRIAKKNGTCFTPFVKADPRMKQKLQFGSVAMATLNQNLTTILRKLNDELHLVYEPDSEFSVKPFNLISPNLHTDDLVKRERYKVRKFAKGLHEEYNGLNPFEVEIADALDISNMNWCRNPSKTGYGIPIPEVGEGTVNFYPDFLAWSSNCLWAIDPKGAHLINDAIYKKILGVSDVEGLPYKIRVAFVLQGQYVLTAQDRPQQQSKLGCTLITKTNAGIRAKQFSKTTDLVVQLK